MKPILQRTLLVFLAIGLCSPLVAQEHKDYAQVSFSVPGGSKHQMSRDQFITLIIDGPVLTYESDPIPSDQVVEYVNKLLEVKNVSYVGLYIREGTTFGDVIRAVDVLRKTKTKNIGVSVSEIPVSRKP